MDETKSSIVDKEISLIDFEDEKAPKMVDKGTQSPSLYQMYIRDPRPWYQMWIVWGYLFLVLMVVLFYGFLTYKQYMQEDAREELEIMKKRTAINGPGLL